MLINSEIENAAWLQIPLEAKGNTIFVRVKSHTHWHNVVENLKKFKRILLFTKILVSKDNPVACLLLSRSALSVT